MKVRAFAVAILCGGFAAAELVAVQIPLDSVIVRFVDAELRAVLQSAGRYLDRPVITSNLPAIRVTLEAPGPVPRRDLLPLLRGLLEANNLEIIADSVYYRVQPKTPPPAVAARQDQGPDPVELRVVRLRHARASDVAATVSALFSGAGADIGGAARIGTLSEELRRNVVPPQASGERAPPPDQRSQPSAVLAGSVTIVPDPVTNSILIRASSRDTDLLRQAIEQLDLRPLQVLIEVTIVEARRGHLVSWGTDIFVPQRGVGPGNATVGGSQAGGGLGDLVLRFLDMGRHDVDAIIRAGASRGNVRILSRPVIMASNNQEARILVGSQRPFVQVSRSLPTDAPSRDQVVQYKDVGTRLTVRPTISSDGYVSLDVIQEVSTATAETAFDAPVISTREAATQVLVRDGQTIVIGGLLEQQRDVTSGGIPFLSELPLLGGLFGRQSLQTSDTELFLFLTPRVLRTDSEVDAATQHFRDSSTVRSGEPRPRD